MINLFVDRKKKAVSVFLGASYLVLSACGGGGNTGGTTPPPPSDSSAPQLSFSPDTLNNVESNQTASSTLTATDNVGITSGPTVSCDNGGTFDVGTNTFTAPVVSEQTTITCTATARDAAGNTGSSTLNVTVTPPPPPRGGVVVGKYNPPIELIYGSGEVGGIIDGYSTAVFGIRPASGGGVNDVEIVALAGDHVHPLDYDRDDHVVVNGTFSSIDFIQVPSLTTNGLGDFGMSVLSVNENKVHWFYGDHTVIPESFDERETIDIEAPCYVADSSTSFNNDAVIGQRSKGLSMFDIDTGTDFTNSINFDATFLYNVGDGRSLCHILRGVIPHSYLTQFPSIQTANTFARPLTAIDYETNEIVFYGDKDGDNVLDELDVVPIDTNSNEPLQIVDVISRGTPSQVPQYMLILLSDGNHNGIHRLVTITFDRAEGKMEQSVYSWNEGVPIAMAQSQFGGSEVGGIFRSDLIVVLGTSENSLFFDNLRPIADTYALPPIYGQPALLEVGVGAGSAIAARKPGVPTLDATNYGILVSFPDNGEIRYISPDISP